MQTKNAKKLSEELLVLGIDVPISTMRDGKKCSEYARLEKVSSSLRDELRQSETLLVIHEWAWPDLNYDRGRTYGQREDYYGLTITLVEDSCESKDHD